MPGGGREEGGFGYSLPENLRQVGMGTRRPGTRQDLGPGTSRGLEDESRDFLYITQPCINIGRLII